MRRTRLLVGLIPVLLAGTAALAVPAPAMAASGVTDTAVMTYTLNPAKAEIDVTITISIKNNTPSTVNGPWVTNYYYDTTSAYVEIEAGPVKATSNAGKVTQKALPGTKHYRQIQFTYPKVYYRQTRVVTVTYAIPAAPRSTGGFRAGKAYLDVCMIANGYDSGTTKLVIPEDFTAEFYSGSSLVLESDQGGLQTYSSGPITDSWAFWSCADGTNTANLAASTIKTSDQTFSLQAWPEDTKWASEVGTELKTEAAGLEALTGLQMPGGTIVVTEAGSSQMGEYIGSYNPKTHTATIAEDADEATVAHELAHVWFNPGLFEDTWMDEGFASYSEKVAGTGNYVPCKDPGRYPASGSPVMTVWKYVTTKSTDEEKAVVTWQYDASCYLVSNLADAMGPVNFRSVLSAADKGEIAYVGAGKPENDPNGGDALSARTLLDLFDERGLVPAGVKDLDKAQEMFGLYGILPLADLENRSAARAKYHELEAAAGKWKMPLAVRSPMASWKFVVATDAMTTASQIIALRDQTTKNLPGFSLDGGPIQTQFENAATQADLTSVADLIKKEADAAAKVAKARSLNDGSHGLLQTIGLLGTDVATPLKQANDALTAAKPDDASAAAQTVIDAMDKSSDQGLMRLGAGLGVLLALLLLALFVVWRRRRGKAAAAALVPPPAFAMFGGTVMPPPVDGSTMLWTVPGSATFDPAFPPAAPVAPADTVVMSEPLWPVAPPPVAPMPAAPTPFAPTPAADPQPPVAPPDDGGTTIG
jgi:hypothetical protein